MCCRLQKEECWTEGRRKSDRNVSFSVSPVRQQEEQNDRSAEEEEEEQEKNNSRSDGARHVVGRMCRLWSPAADLHLSVQEQTKELNATCSGLCFSSLTALMPNIIQSSPTVCLISLQADISFSSFQSAVKIYQTLTRCSCVY